MLVYQRVCDNCVVSIPGPGGWSMQHQICLLSVNFQGLAKTQFYIYLHIYHLCIYIYIDFSLFLIFDICMCLYISIYLPIICISLYIYIKIIGRKYFIFSNFCERPREVNGPSAMSQRSFCRDHPKRPLNSRSRNRGGSFRVHENHEPPKNTIVRVDKMY